MTYVVSLIAFIVVLNNDSFMRPFNYEVLLGILVGLPIVAGLTKLRGCKTDEILGNISYGVFLNHFLLIWVFQTLKISTSSVGTVSFLVVLSVLLAWLTYNLIERPVLTFRHHLGRNQASISKSDLAPAR
jgi:peptidoglycan/LPS O-acetylase OafA/YrhL